MCTIFDILIAWFVFGSDAGTRAGDCFAASAERESSSGKIYLELDWFSVFNICICLFGLSNYMGIDKDFRIFGKFSFPYFPGCMSPSPRPC